MGIISGLLYCFTFQLYLSAYKPDKRLKLYFQFKEINLGSGGYLSQFIKFKSTYSRQACLLRGPEEDLWCSQGGNGGCQLLSKCQPR